MICVRADIWADQIAQAIIRSRFGLYPQSSQLTISQTFSSVQKIIYIHLPNVVATESQRRDDVTYVRNARHGGESSVSRAQTECSLTQSKGRCF